MEVGEACFGLTEAEAWAMGCRANARMFPIKNAKEPEPDYIFDYGVRPFDGPDGEELLAEIKKSVRKHEKFERKSRVLGMNPISGLSRKDELKAQKEWDLKGLKYAAEQANEKLNQRRETEAMNQRNQRQRNERERQGIEHRRREDEALLRAYLPNTIGRTARGSSTGGALSQNERAQMAADLRATSAGVARWDAEYEAATGKKP